MLILSILYAGKQENVFAEAKSMIAKPGFIEVLTACLIHRINILFILHAQLTTSLPFFTCGSQLP